MPRHFFTAALIEPKAKTWPRGRSAPWRGCNILLGQIPAAGRIPLVRAGVRTPRAEVRDRWGASPASPALRAASSTYAAPVSRRAAG